jgi:D-alanine-D-alanine ligase-like ATP-grasp enzyme
MEGYKKARRLNMEDKGKELLERIYKEIDDTIEYRIDSILDEDNENRNFIYERTAINTLKDIKEDIRLIAKEIYG